MRNASIIMLLLVLNLAAMLALLRRHGNQAEAPPPAEPPRSSFMALRDKAAAPSDPPPEAERESLKWAQLESEDYQTYIQRLREIGCPEQTIRDIIIADLDKLMAAELQALQPRREPAKYWKPENKELLNLEESLEVLSRVQELDFEKRRIVSELLGVDLAAERLRQRGERDAFSEKLRFLPEEKQASVRMIIEQSNRAEMRIREEAWLQDDELSPEDRLRLREIERAREREVAALLSPEELDQFNLWFSPSAYKVRDAFFTMDPSEEEFLAVYQLQRAFDQEWGDAELIPERQASAAAARRELELGIQERLGPERYEEYQRMQDRDYRELAIAAAQFNLPPSVLDEARQFRTLLNEHRAQVQATPDLAPGVKKELLHALSEETEKGLVEMLGPRAYKFYIRAGGGNWIWQHD